MAANKFCVSFQLLTSHGQNRPEPIMSKWMATLSLLFEVNNTIIILFISTSSKPKRVKVNKNDKVLYM